MGRLSALVLLCWTRQQRYFLDNLEHFSVFVRDQTTAASAIFARRASTNRLDSAASAALFASSSLA